MRFLTFTFFDENKNLKKKFQLEINQVEIVEPEGNSPSNADKSPVERLSLNRS